MKAIIGTRGSLVDRVARTVTLVVLVALMPGLLVTLVKAIIALTTRPWWHIFWPSFVVGLGVGVAFLRWWPAFCVFEHEFTHMVSGLCFLCVPTNFVVSGRRGGLAGHRPTPLPYIGPLVEDFITLAPYVVPTFSVIVVIVGLFLPASCKELIVGLTALTMGYHLTTTLSELKTNCGARKFVSADGSQAVNSDIAQVGYVLSLVYIPAMAAALHGLTLALLLNGGAGFMGWWHMVWTNSVAFWLLRYGRHTG